MSSLLELPGNYQIIYADPAWQYRMSKRRGAAERHYRTMPLEEIKALPVSLIAAPDCTLFLWATWPMMQEAFEVIDAWGFEYKTIGFNWIKKNATDCGHFFGLGRFTRSNSESCLLATRGKPKRASRAISQLIFEPVGRHSAKPDCVRWRITDLLGDVPRVELFATRRVPGWDAWGDGLQPQQGETHEAKAVTEVIATRSPQILSYW